MTDCVVVAFVPVATGISSTPCAEAIFAVTVSAVLSLSHLSSARVSILDVNSLTLLKSSTRELYDLISRAS